MSGRFWSQRCAGSEEYSEYPDYSKSETTTSERERAEMQVTTVDRIKARRLRWFGHVSRMDSNRIPFLALHTMVDGVRSRGRPRARWRDGVIEDIKERELEFAEATFLTKDRDGWRKFARPYRRDGADGRD